MKNLLKGQIPEEFQLNLNKTFSEQSDVVYKKLIPELKRMMSGHFNPSVTQLSDWLHSLHKHKRNRLQKRNLGTLDKEDRRLHTNARLNEVEIFYFNYLNSFFSLLIINLFLYI